MPANAALVLALVETEWDMPPQLREPYDSMRQAASAGGDSAVVLDALDDLVRCSSDPDAAELGAKVADARYAVAATSASQWFITAPSTTAGVEGHRHALRQAELRRKVFRLGATHSGAGPDGTLTVRHVGGTFTAYVPASEEDYEAFLDGNRRRAVAALGERVQSLIKADETVPSASWAAIRSGVNVHVGGSQISVFWWSATHAEQLRHRKAETTPWSEAGGYRDRIAALLTRAEIQTSVDDGSLQVLCP
jgi:hypothetical protein